MWKNLKKNGIYTFPAWSEEFSGLEGNFIRFTVGTEKEMNKTIEVLSTSKR
jgi:histidinol-phosphate/aromatic aminotransferase/cobyric acid decarboxylase-like protein